MGGIPLNNSKKKKTIYLFTDEFPWGRGEKSFVSPELDHLKKYFQVVIISLSPDKYLEQYDLISHISQDVHVIHYSRSSLLKRILLGLKIGFGKIGIRELSLLKEKGFSLGRLLSAIYALGNSEDLRSFCSRLGIFSDVDNSIYYAFWFNTQCLALAIEKTLGKKITIVARVHGYDLYKERRNFSYQPFQEFKRDMCDRVFFACDYAMEYFGHEYGDELFKGQYKLNYLGVRPGYKTACRSNDNKFRIVSCSRVDSNKRVGIIVEALSKLDRNKYCWTHFGDGSLRDQIEKRAKEEELQVSFKGNVSNSEIIKYYASNPVDLFITTTATEGGCPVSIQEAVSFGIPVIGTKVGGVPEAINGNGVIVGPDPTADEVAKAIEAISLLGDNEIDALREKSLEIWETKFDLEKNKRTLINEMRQLLEN